VPEASDHVIGPDLFFSSKSLNIGLADERIGNRGGGNHDWSLGYRVVINLRTRQDVDAVVASRQQNIAVEQ